MNELYRDKLAAKIEVLLNARHGLKTRQIESVESIRRIAQALKHSGGENGFSHVAEAAHGLLIADEADIQPQLEQLLETLKSAVTDTGKQKLGILVIDDNKDVGLIVRARFAKEGRPVWTAQTGAEAEAMVAQPDIGLILLDLSLPDTDGRNLLVQLRSDPRTAHLPILILSGKSASATKAECFALGADDYIEKPFDIMTLSATISAKLRGVAERTQAASQDTLTGLLNREAFRKAFRQQKELLLHQTGESPPEAMQKYPKLFAKPPMASVKTAFAIAALDLDNFKFIIATHGQELADRCLRQIAVLFKTSLREQDLLTRWENDEFNVLFPQTTLKEAVEALQKLQVALKELILPLPEPASGMLSFSAGVLAVKPAMSVEESIARSRELLKMAKQIGGNCIRTSVSTADLRQKILLAEDDELIAAFIRGRLEREGFDLLHTKDGISALELASDNPINFMILDVNLPGMDGLALLEQVRKIPRYVRIPILMLLDQGHEQVIMRGFQLGADDYIEKPFSPVELLARVRNLTGAKA